MTDRPAILRNLGLKLLALAIALVVWFLFAAQRRERISERTYRIPLSLVNIPAQMVIASPLPPSVEMRVRGPFRSLRQLDPAKLEAVIDIADATRGERPYRLAPEDINVPQEVEVLAILPSEIRIVLDSTAEKSLPITPNIVGTPAPGFAVEEVAVEPRTARVVGPASLIGPMTEISTDPISIEGHATSLSVPATVLPDAAGVRVMKEAQIVTVSVRIRSTTTPTPLPEAPPRPRRR
jgi:YbbR domain-containing protein